MSNDFITSACAVGTNDVLTITTNPDEIFVSTIPKIFEITKLSSTSFDIKIIGSNNNSVQFSVNKRSGVIAIGFFPSSQISPSVNTDRGIPSTICGQEVSTTNFFDVNVFVTDPVSGIGFDGDEFHLRFGNVVNGPLVGDVTITRTKSPFIISPILG